MIKRVWIYSLFIFLSLSNIILINSQLNVDKCGDGYCNEIVCLGTGCPAPETKKSCPEDCGSYITNYILYSLGVLVFIILIGFIIFLLIRKKSKRDKNLK